MVHLFSLAQLLDELCLSKTITMKTRILLLIFLLPILLMSCEKEKFPDNEDLNGSWVENTYLKDRESLYFDGQETLYYTKRPSRSIENDTLIYRLDKKHEMIFLRPASYPDSTESAHKIMLSSKNNELTIWGLHDFSPESKFKKE